MTGSRPCGLACCAEGSCHGRGWQARRTGGWPGSEKRRVARLGEQEGGQARRTGGWPGSENRRVVHSFTGTWSGDQTWSSRAHAARCVGRTNGCFMAEQKPLVV
eukprot:355246-Chlamydomonas_euryale.AAC.7